jgi:hypothetical protein
MFSYCNYLDLLEYYNMQLLWLRSLEHARMNQSDRRSALLNALDAFATEFTRECASRAEHGANLAEHDIEQLTDLARSLASEIVDWRQALSGLYVSRRQQLEQRNAGCIVLEAVFDDALEPSAFRVLRAALDIAMDNL